MATLLNAGRDLLALIGGSFLAALTFAALMDRRDAR